MHKRWIDGLWVGLLAMSVGTMAFLVLPSSRAALLGLTAGATAGLSIWRVRSIVEEQTLELEKQISRLQVRGKTIPAKNNNNESALSSVKDRNGSENDPLENNEGAIAWLNERNIQIKMYRKTVGSDAIFDELAAFIGKRYNRVKLFCESIKRNHSSGKNFSLNLSARTQQEINESTQLGYKLKKYTFLGEYWYNNKTKIIYATPSQSGSIVNFFNGGWFERFIVQEITNLLSQHQVDYQILVNPQIILSNGDDFELDIFYLINDQPLWIECKTGDYQTHITKYANFRKTIAIPPERAFLIILDIEDSLANNLTHLYEISVFNHQTFLEGIAGTLNLTPLPEVSTQSDTEA